MREIRINYDNHTTNIIVLENGKVIELYTEHDDRKTIDGNIYLGKVTDVLPGMQAAFVDIGEDKNAFLHIKDVIPKVSNITGNKNEKLSKSDICKFVKVGMPIVVQVKKDKCDTKGARISTDLNIAGKYVALVPNTNFITISNKLEDDVKEVERLKEIAKKSLSRNNGIVIRTASKGKSEQEISNDIHNLEERYNAIKKKSEKCIKENLSEVIKLYDAGGILNKVLLGLIDSVDIICVNDLDIYNNIKKQYNLNNNTLKLKEKNIISEEIESQIEKIHNRKIWLNCGGFITVDKTEALTAIDVNTGKYTGKGSLEETILKVNKEATIEIAKQIRARDIGGIIIIDYIDMEEKESEEKIVEILNKELKKDRAKTQVVGFTPLHLLEMTRKHLCIK